MNNARFTYWIFTADHQRQIGRARFAQLVKASTVCGRFPGWTRTYALSENIKLQITKAEGVVTMDNVVPAATKLLSALSAMRASGGKVSPYVAATAATLNEALNVDQTSKRIPDQRSTFDQLRDVMVLANKAGMYDAADFIKSHLARMERARNRPSEPVR